MEAEKRWRFEIQYGPQGEANYAWIYDDQDTMIGTMKTQDAAYVVKAVNAYIAMKRTALRGKGEKK